MEEFVQLKVATYDSMRDSIKEYERATSELQDEVYEIQRGAFEIFVNVPVLKLMKEADWQHDTESICNHLICGGTPMLNAIHVAYVIAIKWLKEDYDELKQQ